MQKKKIINMYFATHKTCNLNCSYCYVPKYNKAGRKEDDKIILKSLNEFLEKADDENYAIGSFCLHGSEPSLMAPTTMAEIIRKLNLHWEENKLSGFNVAIQSNGVRFDDEYLDFLEQKLINPKMLRLGFSIDPPKQVHDLYRNKSFDKVEANYLNAMNRGFPVSVLAVVTKETMKHLDGFGEWMRRQLQLHKERGNPYKLKVKLATGDLGPDDDMIREFALFLSDNNMLGLMQILTPGYCILDGNDCMWFEFDIYGNCYSCNKVYNDKGIFANWKEEPFDDIFEKRRALYRNIIRHKECFECEYEFLCNSGCPVDRYKEGKMAGKAHECTLIKTAYQELDKKGIHITEFLNRI